MSRFCRLTMKCSVVVFIKKRGKMAEYSTEDKEEMVRAHTALIKARRSRLQELIEFVKASGFQKIGIANCFSMQNMPIN